MVRGIEVAEVALHGGLGVAPVVEFVAQIAIEWALDRSEKLCGMLIRELHGPREFDAPAYGGVEGFDASRCILWIDERCMGDVQSGG